MTDNRRLTEETIQKAIDKYSSFSDEQRQELRENLELISDWLGPQSLGNIDESTASLATSSDKMVSLTRWVAGLTAALVVESLVIAVLTGALIYFHN